MNFHALSFDINVTEQEILVAVKILKEEAHSSMIQNWLNEVRGTSKVLYNVWAITKKLERIGLLTSEKEMFQNHTGPRRRMYKLTKQGEIYLEKSFLAALALWGRYEDSLCKEEPQRHHLISY